MAIDIEAIRRKINQLNSGGRASRVQFWKPQPGRYLIRGLPWKNADPASPFIELMFYYIGSNRGMLAPSQYDKPDPIREVISKLYESGTPDDRNTAKGLLPKMRAYMPLIVRKENDAETSSTDIVVWGFGKTVYKRLLGFFADPEIEDFLDPKQGFDLKIDVQKVEKKTFFDYFIDPARRPSPLAATAEGMKKILDSVPDPGDMYELKDSVYMEKVLNSWLNGEDRYDPYADKSADTSTSGTSRNVKKSDSLDELANDVAEAAPTKPKAKKSKKATSDSSENKGDNATVNGDTAISLDAAFDELMD